MVELWKVAATSICVHYVVSTLLSDITKFENNKKSKAHTFVSLALNVAAVGYVLINVWR